MKIVIAAVCMITSMGILAGPIEELTRVNAEIVTVEARLATLTAEAEQLKAGITLKVGQTWQDCSGNDDPFKEVTCTKYHIIAMSGNYVQYELIIDNKIASGLGPQSCTVYRFVTWYANALI